MLSHSMLPDGFRKSGEGGERPADQTPPLPIEPRATTTAEPPRAEEAGQIKLPEEMKGGQPLPPGTAPEGGGAREPVVGRGNPPRRYTFPAHLRLKRAAEFERCLAHKVSTADEVLIVYGYPSQLPYPRLGCVVSRKWGKAVRRNRLKRLLREAFRLSQHELPAGID
ncbi:MAG: ribonuclease P protein component, partial [Thermogemmata sp.]